LTDVAETPAPDRREQAKKRLARRRFRLIWLPFWAGGGLVGLVLLAVLIARFAVLTDTGRTTLTGWLDGLDLGRIGTLQLEGLSGDVLGDFKVRRLAIVDEEGVWLEGRDVAMRWRSYSLFRRRLWPSASPPSTSGSTAAPCSRRRTRTSPTATCRWPFESMMRASA
jgi:translocation and assembly module TamB